MTATKKVNRHKDPGVCSPSAFFGQFRFKINTEKSVTIVYGELRDEKVWVIEDIPVKFEDSPMLNLVLCLVVYQKVMSSVQSYLKHKSAE